MTERGRAFPTIREGRPYPASGLTTDEWSRIEPEWVRWADVVTTQRHVSIEALLGIGIPHSRDRHPHLIEHEGVLYLEDGHNRMVRDVLDAREHGFVRVLRR